MSKENKTVELKDEELEKVSGGVEDAESQQNCPDHEYFKRGYIGSQGPACINCTHFISPEGPCNLGHPWWSLY